MTVTEMSEDEKPFTDEDRLDPRSNILLARLMLDSVLPAAMNDGQAIAMGVGYANLAQAEAMNRLAEALEKTNVE